MVKRDVFPFCKLLHLLPAALASYSGIPQCAYNLATIGQPEATRTVANTNSDSHA